MGLVDSLANAFSGTNIPGSTSLANRNISAAQDVPTNLDQYQRVNGLLGTLD